MNTATDGRDPSFVVARDQMVEREHARSSCDNDNKTSGPYSVNRPGGGINENLNTAVMISSAIAANRVASPIISRIGNTCSAKAAI